MSAIDVVCFGEILWDLHETRADTFARHVGGASANCAVALGRLGVKVAAAGAIGSDAFGDALVARLARERVDTRFIVRLPKRTAVTFITRGPRGEPRFHNYREGAADAALAPEHVKAAMARASWIVVGTGTPSSASVLEATMALLDHAARTGASILIDLNARPRLWNDKRAMVRAMERVVARAHVVKASTDDLDEVGSERWLERAAPGATRIVTAGVKGARATGAHGSVHVPARRARCVDATGAGDAFLAGTVAALLAQGARHGRAAFADAAVWTNALEVGHSLGAKAVARVGAAAGLLALGAVRRRLKELRRAK